MKQILRSFGKNWFVKCSNFDVYIYNFKNVFQTNQPFPLNDQKHCKRTVKDFSKYFSYMPATTDLFLNFRLLGEAIFVMILIFVWWSASNEHYELNEQVVCKSFFLCAHFACLGQFIANSSGPVTRWWRFWNKYIVCLGHDTSYQCQVAAIV